MTAYSASPPVRLSPRWQQAGLVAYGVLVAICVGVFALSLYGKAINGAFGDCASLYAEPGWESGCADWRAGFAATPLTPASFEIYFLFVRIGAALPFFVLSLLLMHRRSAELRVLLLASFLLLMGIAGPFYNPFWLWHRGWHTLPDQTPALTQLTYVLDYVLSVGAVLFALLFPDGRFQPRWSRWVALAWAVMRFGVVFFPETPASVYTWPFSLGLIMATLIPLIAIAAFAWRYQWRATPVQRQQMKWITAGGLLLAANYALDYAVWEIYPALAGEYLIATREQGIAWELVQDTLWYVSQFLFAICVGLAVFRNRLWDIDLILSRTLVYGALTGLIVGLYVLIVGGLGVLFHTQMTPLTGLIATAIISMLFQPLRDRLQRGVNRLLYGDRDDPAQVLTRLAQQVETAEKSIGLLPSLVQTIARTLKVPGVSIRVTDGESGALLVDWGSSPGPAYTFPLVYQAETIGQLEVAPRSPHERFTPAEQRLLAAIAALTATTVRAVQLSEDLQRSRQRIVSAREEERRRLRRDLHDGLGPALASLPLKLDAAVCLISSDQPRAEAMLNQVKTQAQSMVAEVRRVVHDLRPPALDELGLAGALRSALAQLQPNPNGLQLSFSALDLPPTLPAAVEAVAFRITLEAVTNVVRHARAERCWITLVADTQPAQLRITVEDDGIGLPPDVMPNVGLHSMRERAEELGGTFIVHPRDGGGTQVMVTLPLDEGGRT